MVDTVIAAAIAQTGGIEPIALLLRQLLGHHAVVAVDQIAAGAQHARQQLGERRKHERGDRARKGAALTALSTKKS